MLQNINVKTKVEAFVTDLAPEIILQLSDKIHRYISIAELDKVFQQVSVGKQKRELDSLFRALEPFFASFSSETPPIILWTRMAENTYKIIM